MTAALVHEGKRSWWDGTVTYLCGFTVPGNTTKFKFFGPVTCPGCIAAKKTRTR